MRNRRKQDAEDVSVPKRSRLRLRKHRKGEDVPLTQENVRAYMDDYALRMEYRIKTLEVNSMAISAMLMDMKASLLYFSAKYPDMDTEAQTELIENLILSLDNIEKLQDIPVKDAAERVPALLDVESYARDMLDEVVEGYDAINRLAEEYADEEGYLDEDDTTGEEGNPLRRMFTDRN